MLKAYPNFTVDYILYELSYANLILYSSVLPRYDDLDTGGKSSSSQKHPKGKAGFGQFLQSMKQLQHE